MREMEARLAEVEARHDVAARKGRSHDENALTRYLSAANYIERRRIEREREDERERRAEREREAEHGTDAVRAGPDEDRPRGAFGAAARRRREVVRG